MQQITLLDYVKSQEPVPVPQLKKDDIIYLVVAGELEKHVVIRSYPLDGYCGYWLDGTTIWDENIGRDAFKDLGQAEQLVKELRAKYKHILVSDMKISDVKTFKNEHDSTSQIAIVNGNMVYLKDRCCYDFMHPFETNEKAMKFYDTTISEWIKKYKYTETEKEFKPRNLYWCKDRYAHHKYFAFNFMN